MTRSISLRRPELKADFATRVLKAMQQAAAEDGSLTTRNAKQDFVRRTASVLTPEQCRHILRLLKDLQLLRRSHKRNADGSERTDYQYFVAMDVGEVTVEMITGRPAPDPTPEPERVLPTRPRRTRRPRQPAPPAPTAESDLDDTDFTLADLAGWEQQVDGEIVRLETELDSLHRLKGAIGDVVGLRASRGR